MSLSALDHPMLAALLGDSELSAIFGFEAEWRAMVAFEVALARAQGQLGVIPPAAAMRIGEAAGAFQPNLDTLRATVPRDGGVVDELLKQFRAAVGPAHTDHVHKAASSQDVVDTSMMLALRRAADVIDERLGVLDAELDAIVQRHGGMRLMAHIRMQRASPFTVADKVAAWRAPIQRHRERYAALRPNAFAVQFGGSIGVRGEMGGKGAEVAALVANALGLANAPAWHNARDALFDVAAWLVNVAGTTGKIGQDLALMGQSEVAEIRIAGGGGSPATAHRSNPVRAEAVVALARYAAVLQAGMGQALVHENERSGRPGCWNGSSCRNWPAPSGRRRGSA